MWGLEVFVFYILMGSTNAPITITSVVEAIYGLNDLAILSVGDVIPVDDLSRLFLIPLF